MDELHLRGRSLVAAVDRETGGFRSLHHERADLELISRPDAAASTPFAIVLESGEILRSFEDCAVTTAGDGSAAHLRWSVQPGLTVAADLRVTHEGDLECRPSLRNDAGLAVAALAYPYIAGIGRLGRDPAADELIHPYATGFLVGNPLDALPAVESEAAGDRPVTLGLYPEGFSGSTMQFLAYGARGRGSFYLVAQDPDGREKWLNFFRHRDGDLRLSVWHGPETYEGPRHVTPPYATTIAALDGGTWYDAAERYKSWAVEQPWTAQGPLHTRDDRCRWLLEKVGLCTFGIDPRHDRSAWLEAIDRAAGTPVLHVTGPSWPRAGADYQNHLPGGLADWFPAAFHERNLEVIRRNGDFLVPFEFDLLFGRGDDVSDREKGTAALQQVPSPSLSRDAYAFPFLCPSTPYARGLHRARDRRLVEDVPTVAGVYYDISVNNVRHRCLAPGHGHRAGASTAVTAAYRGQLAEARRAMEETRGCPVPQGTELINEQVLPETAFYQARAEASPAAPFEAGPFRELIKAGRAEKIPLFTYVYHEFGPVRLDGWAKLSREHGDLVFHTLGRVFVNGGLIELNYEFSALEALDTDHHDRPDEHYYPFLDRRYAVDEEVAAFAGSLSRMRVGPANRYLAYGTMRRPAPMTVHGPSAVDLRFFLYNSSTEAPEYEDRGTVSVPAVLQSAWRSPEGVLGWIFLVVAPEPRDVSVVLDLSERHRLLLHDAAGGSEWLPAQPGQAQALTLPARSPVLLEAVPTASGTAEARR